MATLEGLRKGLENPIGLSDGYLRAGSRNPVSEILAPCNTRVKVSHRLRTWGQRNLEGYPQISGSPASTSLWLGHQ